MQLSPHCFLLLYVMPGGCFLRDDFTFDSSELEIEVKMRDEKLMAYISKLFHLASTTLREFKGKAVNEVEVSVCCNGETMLDKMHQLKKQAQVGTRSSKVFGLPLIIWKFKTRTRPVTRPKRSVIIEDNFGSGDYNEADYYDEDYDYDEGEDLGDTEDHPLSTPEKSVIMSTQKTIISPPVQNTTHPHRHHHGELNPSVNILLEHQSSKGDGSSVEPANRQGATIPLTTPRTLTLTNSEKSVKPESVDSVTDYKESYDYDNYDENILTENPIELNITANPTSGKKETISLIFGVTENLSTKNTAIEQTGPETSVTTSTLNTVSDTFHTTTNTASSITISSTMAPPSSSSSNEFTEFQIIVENSPEIYYTTEVDKASITFNESSTRSNSTVNVNPPTSQNENTLYNVTTEITRESTTLEETSPKLITMWQGPTSTQKLTTIRDITEVEYHQNFNPYIENRLKQQSVIAGKVFRFIIPENTFKDYEDEHDLTYLLLDEHNETVSNNTWLHFNPKRREIYGLPLEKDVSKWIFWVKAFDRDGGSVQEKLNIQVQQHKLDLVVTHDFSLYIRIEKHQEFPHYVDWCLRVLRALGGIYNTNISEITVRHVNSTNEPVIFTWSNDSVATNVCPKADILILYKVLTANDAGDPSKELSSALSPDLRVKKVLYRETGVCEPRPQTSITPPLNFSPILRNPVDFVNATVGELLTYKVKDDTFYDPEDVDPRTLNISLLTADRQAISSDNWLQFDSKNLEFFGIPRRAGRSEYQLVCIDSGGLPASDSLEVIVYPPPKQQYNVEFSMNITQIPHDTFIRSASLQRKFVEKLMYLFGDQSSHNVYVLPFRKSYDSTIVTWYNKSLPTGYCSHEEINRLESILHNKNDNSISHRVYNEMEPEFKVSTIKVLLINNCKARDMRPEVSVPIEDTSSHSNSDEYFSTFIIPAVIILVMLILTAVAAIVLYRRRGTGKMNIEEDGPTSYGNKGIPVIFQEELEEKPEPGTKAPLILKDEKPPLAPPEYSKSGSLRLNDDSEPYQPPPPFTRSQENGKQYRPKPTPTYRKPPPYVPP